jgi:hypothetical protein
MARRPLGKRRNPSASFLFRPILSSSSLAFSGLYSVYLKAY